MKKSQKEKIRILCLFIFIFVLLWVIVTFLARQYSTSVSYPIVKAFLVSFFIISFIFIAFLMRRYDNIIRELYKLLKTIKNLNSGNYLSEKKIESFIPVISEINQAIVKISYDMQEQVSELNQRSTQLDQKNSELNNAYMQLESSYGQLQAVMEQLNESEQRYHSLVINIPDIVLTLDHLGNITYANRACRDILKFRRHDIVGKPFQYIVHDDYSNIFKYVELKQAIEKNGEQLMQIPLRRKDDSLIMTEIKFTPAIESPQDSSIQAIIRDVTEQKRMENTLLENNRRLEILNGFSHKMASVMELSDIYKTCVNTLTDALRFDGAIYFMADKKERFYRISEYSGDYFKDRRNLEYFSYIHCKVRALYGKDSDGIVVDYTTLTNLLMLKPDKAPDIPFYKEAYIQELRIGGEAAGLLLVVTHTGFLQEELDVLRSIGHATAVSVENAMYLIKSKNNYVQTIDALIAAIEAKDQYTRGHSQRVSNLAAKIGKGMGMNREQIEELRIAGILHDIGKIGISDRILLKKTDLTKEEYEEIKKHPAISNKILYPIGLSDRILKAVAFHHERFDGRGYPFGLTNESLGLEPQIISVADAFDAMTSKRPYREPLSIANALKELINNKGSQFHPDIVDVVIKIQS